MSSRPETPCTFCTAVDSKLLFTAPDVFGDHYDLCECKNCGSVFLAPFPSEEKLARAYADDYYGEGDKKFTPLIENILDWFRKGRARRLKRLLGGSGAILDVGCGNGIFLDMMRSMGDFEIHGLEMPGKSANRAAEVEGIQLKIGSLKQGDYSDQSFDAITLYHVFEHLPNPVEYLDIIHKLLKPNGTLVMSFPNITSWQWRKFGPDWFHLDPPRHLFFMPRDAFKREMQKHGFEVIRERHFSIEYNPYGYQQSLLNQWLGKREVLYEHLKGNKEYTTEYSQLHLRIQELFLKVTFPLFIATDLLASLFKRSATVEFVLKKR